MGHRGSQYGPQGITVYATKNHSMCHRGSQCGPQGISVGDMGSQYVPQGITTWATGDHSMCHRGSQCGPQGITVWATGDHSVSHRQGCGAVTFFVGSGTGEAISAPAHRGSQCCGSQLRDHSVPSSQADHSYGSQGIKSQCGP